MTWISVTTKGSPGSYVPGSVFGKFREIRSTAHTRYYEIPNSVSETKLMELVNRFKTGRPTVIVQQELTFDASKIIRALCGIEIATHKTLGSHQGRCFECRKLRGMAVPKNRPTTKAKAKAKTGILAATIVTPIKPAVVSKDAYIAWEHAQAHSARALELAGQFEVLSQHLIKVEELRLEMDNLERKLVELAQIN
jgi:hypothetical protein